jgi:hypothetical protein
MKHLTLLITFSAVLLFHHAALAQSGQVDSSISSNLLIDELNNVNAYNISISNYVCYSSSTAVLQITKESDGYYATYAKISKNPFQKTEKKVSKVKLSDEQLIRFKKFERRLEVERIQAEKTSNRDSRSVTNFTVGIGDKERKYIDNYFHFQGTMEIESILQSCVQQAAL